jgi:hypothetical protein
MRKKILSFMSFCFVLKGWSNQSMKLFTTTHGISGANADGIIIEIP